MPLAPNSLSCLRAFSSLLRPAKRLQAPLLPSHSPPTFASPRLLQTKSRFHSAAGTRPLVDHSRSTSRLPASPLSSHVSRACTFPRGSQTKPRFYSEADTRPLTDRPDTSSEPQLPKQPRPEYELTFTCKPCSTRSSHRISKQGYHYGSVLITCPECKNKHVISDHLNIFGDKDLTIEDLMREQGQIVKKGTLSGDGDLEFWVDGTTTKRNKEVSNGDAGVGKDGEAKGIA